jgi:uncharacterized protein YndB with AHSA1/START domain
MAKKVDRTIVIAAPPERVWKAWVEEMNHWWTKPYYNDHDRVTGLYMEPRLGGAYIEKWGENGEGFLIGNVTQWLPPKRLAYTWTQTDWQGAITLIQIEFEPDGNGGTRMRYLHEGFERIAAELQTLKNGMALETGYDYGWNELSGRLKKYIEQGKPE